MKRFDSYSIAAWVAIVIGFGFLFFGHLFIGGKMEKPVYRQSASGIIAPAPVKRAEEALIAPRKDAEKKAEPTSGLPSAETHVVTRGETIEGIAKRYGVLPWQLRAANGMGAKDTFLRPGQSLAIPSVDWESRAYEGRASWYGPGFHGKERADTKVYDQDEILIAHRTLPLGSSVRITNLHNGRVIVAKVLDRGPYAKDAAGRYTREIDLSRGAAEALDAVKRGIIRVRIEPLA